MTRPSALTAGTHRILGATPDPAGTNFAVWAPRAEAMTLCLVDDGGAEDPVRLTERTAGVWHGHVAGVLPGQRYALRATGPWSPADGLCFDARRLLLDPYARAVTGRLDGPDPQPYGVVVADDFDWGDDTRPHTPWSSTVIYEAHVRGLTRLHPQVPEHLRGTYAGLAHPAVLDHLAGLGVTAVELLPVQQFVTEQKVAARGMSNFWGYNTIGFLAPHGAYSCAGDLGGQVAEFKAMVRALHAAGLEVILDVVYNHTGEGPLTQPALSLRGLDDDGYYRRSRDGGYLDVTGCGNTVRSSHPPALRLVMDSLRYWVTQMRVDGFRFDLASALARTDRAIDPAAGLIAAIGQDPVLRDVKLIAEPWDLGGDGYLVGQFPSGWCEWNDKYRDAVRDFWRGHSHGVRELAYRLSGSSDVYAVDRRLPYASINFVTAHDGFTLRDLVSYDVKHNDGNGEQGTDGADHNRSWNCGVEGETDDEAVNRLRRRQATNLMATLLLSTGVPMLTAGDELGRTQGGNNNAYCQDNPVSWVDWAVPTGWSDLRDLVARLTRLRSASPALRSRHFFDGVGVGPDGRKDVVWCHPSGAEMRDQDWYDDHLRSLGMLISGRERSDAAYLLLLHAGGADVGWALPKASWAGGYELLADTSDPDRTDVGLDPGELVPVRARSLVLLRVKAGRGGGVPATDPGSAST
ncbi:MAG: glycogen debranching protein GlgX [Nocardioidaceae bacterium]